MNIEYIKFIYYGDETAANDWIRQWRQNVNYTYCNRLYYVRGGTGWYIDKSGKHFFKKGHIYFLPQTSSYSMDHDPNDRFRHLYFDFLCVPFPVGDTIYEIDPQNDEILLKLIDLISIYVNKCPFYKPEKSKYAKYAYELFKTLLMHLGEYYSLEFEGYTPLQSSLIYMIKNYSKKISVEDIATQAGYNPKYFIRMFSKKMHITPYHFLRELRISKALVMINAGATVAEAAEATGFEYPSSLSKILSQKR